MPATFFNLNFFYQHLYEFVTRSKHFEYTSSKTVIRIDENFPISVLCSGKSAKVKKSRKNHSIPFGVLRLQENPFICVRFHCRGRKYLSGNVWKQCNWKYFYSFRFYETLCHPIRFEYGKGYGRLETSFARKYTVVRRKFSSAFRLDMGYIVEGIMEEERYRGDMLGWHDFDLNKEKKFAIIQLVFFSAPWFAMRNTYVVIVQARFRKKLLCLDFWTAIFCWKESGIARRTIISICAF